MRMLRWLLTLTLLMTALGVYYLTFLNCYKTIWGQETLAVDRNQGVCATL